MRDCDMDLEAVFEFEPDPDPDPVFELSFVPFDLDALFSSVESPAVP
jgi:hypothetical protein